MSRFWGGVLAVTGFVACPCHLPLTLPLAIGILGGTGAGGFIAANTSLIYGFAIGYFIFGVGVGILLLTKNRQGSQACELPDITSVGDRTIRSAERASARVLGNPDS